jgi:hypothetical protein
MADITRPGAEQMLELLLVKRGVKVTLHRKLTRRSSNLEPAANV